MLKISKLTDKKLVKLRNQLDKAYIQNNISTDVIATPEDIDAIINFFTALKQKDKNIIELFKDIGIYKDLSSEVKTPAEKGIENIITTQLVRNIVYGEKPNFKSQTRKYIKAISAGKGNAATHYNVANILEKRCLNTLYKKLQYAKTNPKLLALIEKHQEWPVEKLLQLLLIKSKITLNNEDLMLIEHIIFLLNCHNTPKFIR